MKTKAWGAVAMAVAAWIVWHKASSSWEPLRAFESKEDCENLATDLFGELKKNNEKNSAINLLGELIIDDGSVRTTHSFLCFPHDFDPRPRE